MDKNDIFDQPHGYSYTNNPFAKLTSNVTFEEFKVKQEHEINKLRLHDICGICLLELKDPDKKFKMFPCLNHAVHNDCYEYWKLYSKSLVNELDKAIYYCVFECTKGQSS